MMKVAIALLASLMLAQQSLAAEHHFGQIPDFKAAYDQSRVVVIGAGQTIAMPSGDLDLLWIDGTCVAPRNADLDLKVREIVVAPGGHLDMGTQASPVLGKVTITFADAGFIDEDAGQWGNGLLVFGKFSCWGAEKDSWIEGEPVGAGWVDGDRLRAADTRPVGVGWNQKYRTSNDMTYGGSGSAGFAQESNDVIGPITANMSRNITFKSENPVGTRGHAIFTDRADVTLGYAAFEGMGRTKGVPISGTNITGRYPVHFHHCMGPSNAGSRTGLVKGIAVDGIDYGTKWGLVVHATSWVRVEDCVVNRIKGAGIVTENGQEVGNEFIGNLAFDIRKGSASFPTDVHEGLQGCGFWCKGMANHFVDNVGMNAQIGFQSAINRRDEPSKTPDAIPSLAYQTSPGGPMSGSITEFQTTLSGLRNRFVCNDKVGYDAWGSSCDIRDQPSPVFDSLKVVPIHWEDCDFAFNAQHQVDHTFTQCASLFTNCRFIGTYKYRNKGSNSHIDYRRVVYFDSCFFERTVVGAETGRGAIIANCIFNTDYGIEMKELDSQGFPYGVTIRDNIYSEATQPILLSSTIPLDLIPEHELTLEQVYQIIDDFRQQIGSTTPSPDPDPDPDPNAAERERILEEIATLQAQVAAINAQIAELQQQLEAL